MVYAFIAHSLLPGTCRVLYSTTFGLEDSQNIDYIPRLNGEPISKPESGKDRRVERKEQMSLVAKQVQSEFSFRKTVLGCTVEDDMRRHSIEDPSGNTVTGCFRLSAGEPFVTEKIVVWQGLGNFGLSLVCEKHENRLQAEAVLKLLARYSQEHMKALDQPHETLLKADKMAAIVHHILPQGRLLFMNHTVTRQLEKELENMISAK
ncbi:AP-5 complex subunit sigma-1-like [Anneissia japonica]|uniref:AP-5 complex subunit sigma-1-like n=1 Tax=Anneissia japonica TaxID=1529436 RepID=UPI00142577ED|nr:AP-5 complex subunit sigma-1-like [Anneissia japonica]